MAEDIAYLLSRGELAEPLETEQSEINRLVDKSKVKDFIDQQKKEVNRKLHEKRLKHCLQVARIQK
jgi:hypothetical protein